MLSFSGVMFVLLFLYCFVFVFFMLSSLKPWPFVQSFFDIIPAPRQPNDLTCYVTIVSVLFFSVEMSLLPSIFVPLPFPRCIEGTSYIFPIRMVFFYLVTTDGLGI